MTRLHALGARLSNSLELPKVLEEVLAAVTELQGTDRGVLMLHDRGRDSMTTAASVGFTAEEIDAVDGTAAEAPPGEAITAVISGGLRRRGRPDATRSSSRTWRPPAARAATPRAARPCSPAAGCSIGTIATYFPRPHRPTDRETRLVELYARQAAEFIDNARLYREIREADRHKDEFLAMLAPRAAQPARAPDERPAHAPPGRPRSRRGRAGPGRSPSGRSGT